MMKKVLTAKDIHIAVKKPDGMYYLMERFDFATPEALFAAIRRVAPLNSEVFIRDLSKKNRKFECAMKQPKGVKKVLTPTTQLISQLNIEEFEETDEDEIIQAEETPGPTIESLRNDETELSTMLCEMEGIHKGFVSSRRKIVEEFYNIKKFISKLKEQIAEKETQAELLQENYSQYAAQMRALNDDMKACQEILTEIRGKIADRMKVTIFVYENGAIEVENAQEEYPAPNADIVKEEFDRLVQMPEAADLSIKNVRTVATIKTMLDGYDSKNVELVFDSVNVQHLYELALA